MCIVRAGEIASWKRVNRRFLNLVRKQLLIWRTFSADIRGEFHERGRQESETEDAPNVGGLVAQANTSRLKRKGEKQNKWKN